MVVVSRQTRPRRDKWSIWLEARRSGPAYTDLRNVNIETSERLTTPLNDKAEFFSTGLSCLGSAAHFKAFTNICK